MKRALLVLLLIASAVLAQAQQVNVNKENRTITVNADQTLKFDAEVSRLTIGRDDYGATQESVLQENQAAMNKILSALKDAGVKPEQIETESFKIDTADPPENVNPEAMKLWSERRAHINQRVVVTARAKSAQAILDAAMNAGANDVGVPEWALLDYDAANAKVAGAALKKARAIAEQMAQGLGTRLGELVYASNQAPSIVPWWLRGGANTLQATVVASPVVTHTIKTQVFPKAVEVKATVYATFAIE